MTPADEAAAPGNPQAAQAAVGGAETASWLLDKNRLGVLAFLASESVFFGLLIIAYLYFRPQVVTGPTAATVLRPGYMAIFSVLLWASSGTMWLAGRALQRRRYSTTWLFLALTILLGLGFIAGESSEWYGLITRGVFVDTNLFGTTFFTLTGFHGLHVIVGLIMLTILLILGLRSGGRRLHKPPTDSAVDAVGTYWHYVDWVWLIIYSAVYLLSLFR